MSMQKILIFQTRTNLCREDSAFHRRNCRKILYIERILTSQNVKIFSDECFLKYIFLRKQIYIIILRRVARVCSSDKI